MSNLFQLQEQLQHFIMSGHSAIMEHIVPTERIGVADRLAIYSDAYTLRLTESLSTSFPALHLYYGTEEFNRLCRTYIDNYPSSCHSIRWYGDALAEFIKKNTDKSHLAELADFEWRMTLAFDAADDPVLTIEEMAGVPPESWAEMYFIPHGSVQRLNYFWNVIPVWQSLVHDNDLPEWNEHPNPVPWILWRSPEQLIQFYSMAEEEAGALDAVIQGMSFATLCEGLCQWMAPEDVGMKAASYLKNWIQNGILSQMRVGSS
ncbi:DNA-binding domain-containing protein [Legionella shakespearei]|uniref:Putative DNA-binding domain-containing protein n=1 Tax=Legionella shakespearei DSM 23087 TaxID=1122169 RepID=A0A0W0Z630_9GAMM|nr:putative DNA-binding domain-containing protein [Legionella shakespearei]KTD64596.1 hypothetical protein Lsha_0535 [Legionella shakespearei DSM 23087]